METFGIIKGDYRYLRYETLSDAIMCHNIENNNLMIVCPEFPDDKSGAKTHTLESGFITTIDVLHNTYNCEQLRNGLMSACLHFVICAHGESGHIKLPGSVLCAQDPSEQERTVEGRVIERGCHNTHCRRIRDEHDTIYHCEDIQSEHIYLLSCNSACIAGDLYPSGSSLIRGFFRTGVKSVLGCLDCYEYSPDDIDLVSCLLLNGATTAEISWIMNQISYKRHGIAPFCTFVRDLDGYSGGVMSAFQKISLPEDGIVSFDRNGSVLITGKFTGLFYKIETNSELPVRAYFGDSVILLLDINETCGIRVIEYSQEMFALEQYLKSLMERISFWEALFDTTSLNSILDEVLAYKRLIASIGVRVNDMLVQGGCLGSALDRLRDKLNDHVIDLEKKIARCFYHGGCIYAIENIRKSYLPPVISNTMCPYCTNRLNRYLSYDQSVFIDNCGLCGVQSVSKYEFQVLMIQGHSCFQGIQFRTRAPLNKKSVLFIEILDKARGTVVQKILRFIDLRQGYFSLSIDIESAVGNDLHTYRGLILSDLDFIYFRGRFLNLSDLPLRCRPPICGGSTMEPADGLPEF